MEWELTDEELINIDTKYWIVSGEKVQPEDELPLSVIKAYERVAQAQAKKLVKWLGNQCKNENHNPSAEFMLTDCIECWQELRRQVGLE